jgi:hypothetical protein
MTLVETLLAAAFAVVLLLQTFQPHGAPFHSQVAASFTRMGIHPSTQQQSRRRLSHVPAAMVGVSVNGRAIASHRVDPQFIGFTVPPGQSRTRIRIHFDLTYPYFVTLHTFFSLLNIPSTVSAVGFSAHVSPASADAVTFDLDKYQLVDLGWQTRTIDLSLTIDMHNSGGSPVGIGLVDMVDYHLYRTPPPSASLSVRGIGALYTIGCTLEPSFERDITYVSQMTPDRVRLISLLTKTWHGPMAFAVYMTSDEDEVFLQQVEDLRQMGSDVCIDLLIVRGDARDAYPVNLLRNRAAKLRRTEKFLIVDMDFMPSLDTIAILKAFPWPNASRQEKVVPVVPCFQFRHEIVGLEVIDEFRTLKVMWDSGAVVPAGFVFPPGQRPSDSSRWFHSESPYEAPYAMWYEPYIVCDSRCPGFDERFVGWGMDKVSLFYEMHAAGWKFVVTPRAFLFHRPHDRTKDWSSKTVYEKYAHKRFQVFMDDVKRRQGSNI